MGKSGSEPYNAYKYLRRLGRVCADCPATITDINKTGRCKNCASRFLGRDPAFQATRAEAIRRKFRDDPRHAAKMVEVMREIGRKARADPAHHAWMVEHGHRQIAKMFTPEARAKVDATRAEVGRKVSEKAMAWCPPAYRAEYHAIVRSKRMKAADARFIILAKVKADRDALSPFERQMADLEAKMKRGETNLLSSNEMFRRRAA